MKYIVKISRTEWFETTIEAENDEQAFEQALNEAYNGDSFYWTDLQSGSTDVYSVEKED
jgi:hypothetical protein